AIVCDHDVRSLQIVVNDRSLMKIGQTIRDLSSKGEDLPHRQRTLLEPLFQVLPFVVRHDNEQPTVACRLDTMNPAQAGMIERTGDLRLEKEPLPAAFVAGEAVVQALQRHDPSK